MKAFNKKKNSRPKEVIINKNMSNQNIVFKNKVLLMIKCRNFIIENCYFEFLIKPKALIYFVKCKNITIKDCNFVNRKKFVYKNK